MAVKFNSFSFISLSIVVSFTFSHVFAANGDRKLLNSFGHVSNTLALFQSPDGWQPIDVNDPKVVDIAKFAVNTENSLLKDIQLEFDSVSDGQFQVDNNGTTYQLTIVAIEFDEANEYSAVVYENSTDNVSKLISFD
ncbi:cysteine proteinase inhibitor 6-like [Lycium ferocissimum]|uniref:cysteine proteinase inhibitor 6-like n=1 Tax=Lycium ferocissimum TaxID=112874 RepID=UPI002814A67F|nr:cysteine proteinase inhibitor 6-like [Lycium ferocissimum]